MTSRLQHVAVGLLAWVLMVAVPVGQSTPATQDQQGPAIEGTITDGSGAAIPGVTVTLDDDRYIRPIADVTDIRGKYRFAPVLEGDQTIKAELTGFKRVERKIIVPATGVLTVNFTLEVGGIAESVEVSGAAPIVDTRRTTTGATFNLEVMDGIPTARDPWGVVNPSAGVAAGQSLPFGRNVPITDTENYAHIETNPFRRTLDEPLSTFAADVDTASYTNVRRFLRDGQLPPPDAVRVEELINYFHYQYPDPSGEHPVSVTTEVGAAPWAPDHRLVLVGVKAQPIEQRDVSGRNIVLLIDVSGSMSAAGKLGLLKTGLRMFVDTLRDDDRIAIVVYAGSSGLVLPSTRGVNRSRIHDALESLHAGGSTNGGQGIRLAYQVATEQFVPGGINRVILATDGDFNVGTTSEGDLQRLIEEKKRSGIFLSVLGVGTGNLQDATMEMLADKGNGHYAYLDGLHEARRVLVREGGATLETVAKDVKFQVEFNPATVAAWRQIGYENRQLAHQDFNDDTKDGGELGAGHTVTVLYEIVPVGVDLPEGLPGEEDRPVVDPLTYQQAREGRGNTSDLLTVKIRYKQPDEDHSTLLTQVVRVDATASAGALPLATAVAEFGMLLRTPGAAVAPWTALVARLADLPVTIDEAADHQQFVELVELAAGLQLLRERGR